MRGRRVARRSTVRQASGAAVYDPAVLDLTLWVRNPYTAPPWVGTASAGISSGEDMVTSDGTDPAASGGDASFNGTDSMLQTEQNMTAYIGDSAYSGWSLVNVAAIATDSGSPFSNDGIAASRGSNRWAIYLRSSGLVGIAQFTAGGNVSKTTAFTTGVWTLVQYRFDGVTLEIRTNGNAWQTVASDPLSSSTLKIRLGATNAGFLNGLVREQAFSKTRFDDTTFDNVLSYARAYHGVSLT